MGISLNAHIRETGELARQALRTASDVSGVADGEMVLGGTDAELNITFRSVELPEKGRKALIEKQAAMRAS